MGDPLEDLRAALSSGTSLRDPFRRIVEQFLEPNSLIGPLNVKAMADEIEAHAARGGRLTPEQHVDLTEAQALILGKGKIENGLSEFGFAGMRRGLEINSAMAAVAQAAQELKDAGRLTDLQHRMALADFGRISLEKMQKLAVERGVPGPLSPRPQSKGCALLLVSMLVALGLLILVGGVIRADHPPDPARSPLAARGLRLGVHR